MPQKRNPVALEHARAIGSKALGQAQAIVTHRPQHAVRRHRRHRGRSAAARVRDVPRRDARGEARRRGDGDRASSTPARLEARAGDGWTTLTELADTLVRDHGLPFRTAHAIAARLVGGRQRDPKRPLAALLADASTELLGAPLDVLRSGSSATILSPRHFVEVRRTLGGPAPEETARAAERVARSSSRPTRRGGRARPTRSRTRSAARRAERRAVNQHDAEPVTRTQNATRPRPTT